MLIKYYIFLATVPLDFEPRTFCVQYRHNNHFRTLVKTQLVLKNSMTWLIMIVWYVCRSKPCPIFLREASSRSRWKLVQSPWARHHAKRVNCSSSSCSPHRRLGNPIEGGGGGIFYKVSWNEGHHDSMVHKIR